MINSRFVVLVVMGAALAGCGRTSQREARFLNERKVIIETVRSCFQRPYDGLSRWMPKDVPSNLDLPGQEEDIRRGVRVSGEWYGDMQWEVVYRPAVEGTNQREHPIDPTKLLDFYFGQLERWGFTRGVRGGQTSLNSIKTASETWVNGDHTLLVMGYVVSDKQSGEIIITTAVRETLSR